MARRSPSFIEASISAFSVPWNAFVGVFLYYVLLTLIAVGGAELPLGVMVAVYAAPPVAYLVMLVNRGIRALASLPIDLGETPHALQR